MRIYLRGTVVFTTIIQEKIVLSAFAKKRYAIFIRLLLVVFRFFKTKLRPLEDNRGLHENRGNKIADETRELVRQHISSFPKQENHYSRRESKKQCLNPDLSVKRMWELFCIKYPDTAVTLHLYRDIFHSDFCLRFGVPRSDTCKQCDLFYNQMLSTNNEAELKRIENESKIHHMRADLAYKSLADDSKRAKNNPQYVMVCIDLQQILFCPTLTHVDVFYQRQMSCYNLLYITRIPTKL